MIEISMKEQLIKGSSQFKGFLIVLFSLFVMLPSNAQVDSTAVPFVAYWSVGDSYDFKITKIKQQTKDGVQTKNEEHQYIANFTVIDSTESSYTVNWSFDNELENTYDITEELAKKLSKYKLTEIKYKTSEVGEFIEVINWKEVSEMMSNLFDDLIEGLAEEDDDEEDREMLQEAMLPFKRIYSSKQGIEQLVAKELQYFHFPMGYEFEANDTLRYDDELPNMFGGDPIKAKAKIYFTYVDFEDDFCVLKHEMNLNPEDTRKVINTVFETMDLDEKDFKQALKTAVFKIEDRNTYEYYFDPGIPHKIEAIRETNININNEKGTRIDKTIIELQYED